MINVNFEHTVDWSGNQQPRLTEQKLNTGADQTTEGCYSFFYFIMEKAEQAFLWFITSK